jgi:F0F1-type ATP synthase membrane subunit c/vacuolar-type H+-ATPase subunit K
VGGIEHGLEVVLIFAIAILGPSLILAAGGYASIQALGRNPSAAPKIFTALIILLVFGAAISVIALLILFQLYAPA